MRKFQLPVWGHAFAEDANNSDKKLSVDEQASTLKKDNPELYSAIFGRGSTKGAKEVTDARVSAASDEQKQTYFNQLKRLKVDGVLLEKAKVLGFHNPEDAVDFLKNSLTLNDQLEVCASDGTETNIDDALHNLAQRSPHLVKASPQRPGQGSKPPAKVNTAPNTDKPTFKRSQLRDSAFYIANEKAILEAARDNRIVDDC